MVWVDLTLKTIPKSFLFVSDANLNESTPHLQWTFIGPLYILHPYNRRLQRETNICHTIYTKEALCHIESEDLDLALWLLKSGLCSPARIPLASKITRVKFLHYIPTQYCSICKAIWKEKNWRLRGSKLQYSCSNVRKINNSTMLCMHDADIKPRIYVRIILCYGLPNASINICDLIGTACLAQAITVRLGTSCKESHYPLVSVVL